MKPSLQLKLSQHLALTPQLQQSIKLLQLSTLELNQEIERYLLENPLLESGDEGEEGHEGQEAHPANSEAPNTASNESSDRFEADSPKSHDEDGYGSHEELHDSERDLTESRQTSPGDEDDRWASDAGSYSGSGSHDEDDEEAHDIHAATISLREHLTEQLCLTQLSEIDRALVRFLIEALDDDGYLATPLEELLETLDMAEDEEREETLEALEIALRHLQHFDPPGVGARTPAECLQLQLQARMEDDGSDTEKLALVIARDHLELLAARDFAKLKKLTGCNDEALRAAQQLITSLNPRPGAHFAAVETRYITPDVIVKKLRGQWTAQINPDAYPRLRVNRLYAEILSQQRRGEGGMSGQLQEARWLIKNVQQRFETIQRVAQAIVDRQSAFFEHGEVAMKPLVLREIADTLDLHESTISRVTSQKYMATARGIFELKYFFGSHVSTDTGGACSATAIRALIKQMIGAEDSKKPLSDSQISEILGQQGIVVARRTVAKYREALNIPPVNLRKTL
jgi:RNA polymerase sigma-54 factor